MSATPSRRTFLQASAGATAAGLTAVPFLGSLRPVSAAEARLDSNLVRLDGGIEPLVRLLEETPRNTVLEEVAHRVKAGLGYRDLLAALLLAGVRNVQPRPNVGFKFHAVLVVNSAHLASLAGPDRERWLPIFWAIDNFKSAQAQNLKESGWRMKPVDEMKLPRPTKARAAFVEAMTNWDEEAADAAVAVLARTAAVDDLFDLFAGFGCRDFRDIGHKAIYVANAFRTLEVIGWHHAEPVLRSLAYALLRHEGDNPAKRDGEPDRPGRRNLRYTEKLPAEWALGQPDPAATSALLTVLRNGPEADAAMMALKLMRDSGASPRSIWDALFLGAGELLMRQPGIVGLHTLTTMNALHYAFQRTGKDVTRLMLLLQGASFLPLFREAMKGRGPVGDVRIDALEPADRPADAEAVFAELSRDKAAAARLALGYLKSNGEDGEVGRHLIDAGRRLIFLKGTDSHDYKFSSAVLEDYAAVSPEFRNRFLAASLYWMKGSGAADAPIVKRIQTVMG
jgi:hypothetical protein